MQGNYETARRWSDVYAAQDERRRKEADERRRKESAERAAAPTGKGPLPVGVGKVRPVGALHCGTPLWLFSDGSIRLDDGRDIETIYNAR